MVTKNKQSIAAQAFVKEWKDKGSEKGETQRFWLSLLHNVFGIDDPTKMMQFEIPVKTFAKDKGTDFLDAYINATKVLIEQKGSKIDLEDKEKQSDGMMLTPYQQALRYLTGLPNSMSPRWIVTCNFKQFNIYDMEHPNVPPQVVMLEDLEKEYYRLEFLVNDEAEARKKEFEVSIKAGEIVGILYDKILAQYRDPNNLESQKSLNKLCVRLVFCLYAEDAGLFGRKDMFHDYLKPFPANQMRRALIDLFEVLNTPMDKRDPYLDEALAQFPYANGGLFGGDSIEIPQFTDELKDLLLERASYDFDWSEISPTIFGAVFESTLNPDTRRAGGMHYTSIENIHKVIDPLFLDDLKAELASIKAIKSFKERKAQAVTYQDKIAGLRFFDPACGSGNFLTETYTSLRRLENDAIRIIYGGDRVMGAMVDPIKVSINQFYGIEINDFACSVAQTALWIAESQMMQETDKIVGYDLDPLPLKTYNNIHEGNALRMDWNDVVPANELNYIMGNPPWIGKSNQTAEQKADMAVIFNGVRGYGNLDYVASWFKKVMDTYGGSRVSVALVATSSVCQGIAVPPLWSYFYKNNWTIDFAHLPFKWTSESSNSAQVACVIIGFSNIDGYKEKRIYCEDGRVSTANNINAYLLDAPNIIVNNRNQPLGNVPPMIVGSCPADGGGFILSPEEKDKLLLMEPDAFPFIHEFMGGEELINNKKRYCLWLKNIDPHQLRLMPEVIKRVNAVRAFRLKSKKEATKKKAATPTLFTEDRYQNRDSMVIPIVSSERRPYLPVAFINRDVIPSNLLMTIPSQELWLFGLLTSSVHQLWVRTVGGKMESRQRYTGDVVYNTFPWPILSTTQRETIAATAQKILEARALYPNSSLADLYDDLTMPPELRKAHLANDAAVIAAYGFPKDATEAEIVARLFAMYQELTAE